MFRFVEGNIVMEPLEHSAMEEELSNPEYGRTRKNEKSRRKKSNLFQLFPPKWFMSAVKFYFLLKISLIMSSIRVF